jgi:hypothetical protein
MYLAGDLTEFVQLLKSYKIESAGLIGIAVVLYILIKNGVLNKVFTTAFEKYIDYFIKNKNKSNLAQVSNTDIMSHDIFSYIDFWRYSKVPTLKFSSDFRTVVFRKYLSIYLKSHKEKIQSYVNSKTFLNMSDSELWRSLLTLLNDIVYNYESEMINSGIPKLVVEKMKSRNNDMITLTINLIENICTSNFYKTDDNLLKVYSVLNILLSILENAIQNSETVCNSINGELRGLEITEGGITYRES